MTSLGADAATDKRSIYDEYVEKYGKQNADYLMEVMGEWQKHYDRSVFIDQGIVDTSSEASRVKAEAEAKGWRFERLPGDLSLIRRLLFGEWDESDFLTLAPGERITLAFGGEIITKVA